MQGYIDSPFNFSISNDGIKSHLESQMMALSGPRQDDLFLSFGGAAAHAERDRFQIVFLTKNDYHSLLFLSLRSPHRLSSRT